MGIAGIVGMAIATVVTVRPEALRLADLFHRGYALNDVLRDATVKQHSNLTPIGADGGQI